MFILMSSTIETKYIPMICDKSRTTKLELFGLEIQMKNLDMVRRRPRVEETTIAPTWNKIETKNVLNFWFIVLIITTLKLFTTVSLK